MTVTSKNLIKHELIGLKVKIEGSKHLMLRGLKGLIINETLNTITIDNGIKKMIIPKSTVQLSFALGEKKVTVDGKALVGRPEDRIKSKKRIWL
jgi:ribonuclease P protein subunit POP4